MTTEKQNLIGKEQHLQSAMTFVKDASENLGEGEFITVLTTGALDAHGEHVLPEGGTVPAKTLKMYFNHITWGEVLPIGVWKKVWYEAGKWFGHGKIDLVDDFEKKIYAKVKNGTLDSVSIGFRPEEYDVQSDTWTKWMFTEASIVNEPANPEALIMAKSAMTEIDEAMKEKLKSAEVAEEATDQPTDEPAPADETVSEDATPATPEQPEESNVEAGDVDADMNAALEELKSKVGALEEAVAAANDSQSKKSVIRVRMAGKEVDKTAETLNQIIKVKLKGSN